MKSSLIRRYISGVLGLALFGGWQVGALAVAASVDAEPRLELPSLVTNGVSLLQTIQYYRTLQTKSTCF